MTDSRVTPQAAAKEREHVALTAATYTLWRYDYRGQSSEWFDAHHPEEWHWERAERALTAAVPLLCQPLQDEIDRAYAEIRKCINELDEIVMDDDVTRFVMSQEDAGRWSLAYDRLSAFIDEVAPVGTGNPTQPRADD